MFPSTIPNQLCLVLGGVVLWLLYKARHLRLSHIKGPFLTGWFSLLHGKAIYTDNVHLWYTEVNQKYGTLARIGPNDLLTSSPDLVFRINAVRSPYTKAEWFYGGFRFENGRDNVTSQMHEQTHDKQRRRLAPAFTAKKLSEMEPILDKKILGMVDLVQRKYFSTDSITRPLDLGDKFQFLGLDLITDIGFGGPFGNIEHDRDTDDYVKFQKRGLRIWVIGLAFGITRLLQNPLVAKILSPDDSESGGGGLTTWLPPRIGW